MSRDDLIGNLLGKFSEILFALGLVVDPVKSGRGSCSRDYNLASCKVEA